MNMPAICVSSRMLTSKAIHSIKCASHVFVLCKFVGRLNQTTNSTKPASAAQASSELPSTFCLRPLLAAKETLKGGCLLLIHLQYCSLYNAIAIACICSLLAWQSTQPTGIMLSNLSYNTGELSPLSVLPSAEMLPGDLRRVPAPPPLL